MTDHPIHAAFGLAPLAMDRAGPKQRADFSKAKKVEESYARRLRKIARHVGDIVSAMWDGSDDASARIADALNGYAESIKPWAEAVASRMIAEVDARDKRAWMTASRRIGRALQTEMASGAVGAVVRGQLASQVDLITSLPREAAERVHKLTTEGLANGIRPSEIAARIMETGGVTASRATLIARTETSRTASELTEARATSVQSPGYWWRTSGDKDVRPSHAAMNGKFVAWGSPPTLDGMMGHAGRFPNCRCYPEPVISDD